MQNTGKAAVQPVACFTGEYDRTSRSLRIVPGFIFPDEMSTVTGISAIFPRPLSEGVF